MKRSFYEILGVQRDADQAGIDAAYSQATQRVNADIKRGAAAASMEAQLLRDGYQLLSDPAKRSRYDAKMSAAESGVKLMFFPDDKGAQRQLGVQTVIFAVAATTFVGVMFWQMNRKVSEVRADYETVVARKQIVQAAPKIIEEVKADTVVSNDAGKADINAPKVSDKSGGETIMRVIDPAKTESGAKGAVEIQAKR
jgi:DnaJ-class molecular chaperone